MYTVYDFGKPADCRNHKVEKSWDQSTYPTFEEAAAYAIDWLGIYGHGFTPETFPRDKYDYSGYGTFIEIRED